MHCWPALPCSIDFVDRATVHIHMERPALFTPPGQFAVNALTDRLSHANGTPRSEAELAFSACVRALPLRGVPCLQGLFSVSIMLQLAIVALLVWAVTPQLTGELALHAPGAITSCSDGLAEAVATCALALFAVCMLPSPCRIS